MEGMISGFDTLPREDLNDSEYIEVIHRSEDGTTTNMKYRLQDLFGPRGTEGDRGETGKSAFEIAQGRGFNGTEAQWIESLGGSDAFQVAAANGFEGTREQWLDSLVGKDAFQVAQDAGFTGTREEWLATLEGRSAYRSYVNTTQDDPIKSEEEWLESLAGQSAFSLARENGFDGSQQDWLLSLIGPQGEEGPQGKPGKSPYDLALENGFKGTEKEWLKSLNGTAGPGLKILGSFTDTAFLPKRNNTPGDAYIINKVMWVWDSEEWAPVGQIGPTGDSAYQTAVKQGFSGSQRDWLASLKGDSAYQVAVAEGFRGSKADWLKSLNGLNGKDTFQIAQDEGYEGTRSDWLASLVGPRGPEGRRGQQGPQGEPSAAIQTKGQLDTADELPTDNNEPGDAYYVEQNLWVWTGASWFDAGEVKGDKGDKGETGDVGPQGPDGKSSYDLAVEQGYSGTKAQYLTSLKGDTGKSAFESAVDLGFVGDEADWQLSLKGDAGLSAYEMALQAGLTDASSEAEYLESLKGEQGDKGETGEQGEPGKDLHIEAFYASAEDVPETAELNTMALVSNHLYLYTDKLMVEGESEPQSGWLDLGPIGGANAYQVAVANGFDGDETQWLASLRGLDAYQVAVDRGYAGSVDEWLTSLVGPQGDEGQQGPQGKEGPMGAAVVIKDTLSSTTELPTANNSVADGYLIERNLHVWDGTRFTNIGPIAGPQGKQGLQGRPGDKGETGETGPSAYQSYLETTQDDPKLSETDWLASLVGPSAYAIYLQTTSDDPVLSKEDWLTSLIGPQGASAYQVYAKATSDDPVLTREQWLKTLKGDSAYRVYVANTSDDPILSQQEWLASLIGPQGKQGERGDVGVGINPRGKVDTSDDLPTDNNENGDAYFIDGNIWVWIDTQFEDLGSLQGPQGEDGPEGKRGLQGEIGKAAYQSYVDTTEDNPVMTETQWVKSLNGDDAYTVYRLTTEDDPVLSRSEWLLTLVGPQGESAFELFKNANPDSSLDEVNWLDSLNGNRWIVMGQDPGPVTGQEGDLFYNFNSQEVFQKVDENRWASVGHIGGGNVYDAPQDGAMYGRIDGKWKEITADVEEAPKDEQQYARRNGEWQVITADVTDVSADDEPTVRRARVNGNWVKLLSADPLKVRDGSNDIDFATAKVIFDVFKNMGITYNTELKDWVNDAGHLG